MRKAVHLWTVILVFVAAKPTYAESTEPVKISEIEISGLKRTKPYVVLRELPFEKGEMVSVAQIEEGLQRLRNLGLFNTATHQLHGETLHVTVVERWTLLPAFKLSSGGGATQLTVAVFDVNVLGRYLEFGAQYERLGSANSFVVWHRNPRLFDKRLLFGADLWTVDRPRILYDTNGEIEGGFLLERILLATSLEKENQKRTVRFGGRIRGILDDFSLRFLPDEAIQSQTATGPLPDRVFVLTAGLTLALGTINTDRYLQEGTELRLEVDAAPPVGFNDIEFVSGTAQFIALRRFGLFRPNHSTVALRLLGGGVTTKAMQHLHYVGGLDRVRGFLDSRFRGQVFGVANLELRVPSIDSEWVALQHVAFVDGGVVSRDSVSTYDTVASAGLGLRFISPMINRLVVRVDFAFLTAGSGTRALGFGIQQFF